MNRGSWVYEPKLGFSEPNEARVSEPKLGVYEPKLSRVSEPGET